jgi:hypothetical protein
MQILGKASKEFQIFVQTEFDFLIIAQASGSTVHVCVVSRTGSVVRDTTVAISASLNGEHH